MIKKLMMLGGSIWFFAAVGMKEVNDFQNVVPIQQEGENPPQNKKELFLYYWEAYLENYIKNNDIKLDNNDEKDALTQWHEKLKKFKKRLKKVKPLYANREKQFGYKNFLEEAIKVDAINKLYSEDKVYDFFQVGGNRWLLVALGLARKSVYLLNSRNDRREIEFLEKNATNFEKYLTILKNEEALIITAKEPFFNEDFVKEGIGIQELFPFSMIDIGKNNFTTKNALFFGSLPQINSPEGLKKLIELEGEKYNSDLKKEKNSIFINNCIVLIPGITLIISQTPYTIVYGRLIQYALVYLESQDFWEKCLKLKMSTEYSKGSWLYKESGAVHIWYPYQADPIVEMMQRSDIEDFLKRIEEYKKFTKRDYSKGNKESVEKDLQRSKNNKEHALAFMIYQRYKDFLQDLYNKFPKELKAVKTQKEISEQQQKFMENYNKNTQGKQSTWNRFKHWIFGGAVVTGAALGSWILYKYFNKPAPKVEPQEESY